MKVRDAVAYGRPVRFGRSRLVRTKSGNTPVIAEITPCVTDSRAQPLPISSVSTSITRLSVGGTTFTGS
jgi:hypothetical protein